MQGNRNEAVKKEAGAILQPQHKSIPDPAAVGRLLLLTVRNPNLTVWLRFGSRRRTRLVQTPVNNHLHVDTSILQPAGSSRVFSD